MADKTVAQKLNIKPEMAVAVLNAPDDMADHLGLPAGVTVIADPAQADFLLLFVASQAEAESRVAALAPQVSEGAVAWIAYPKGSRAAGHDLNRDTIADFVRTVGLVVVANFSIDERWSALRVRPLKPGE
jgi:hypothetical protein